MTRSLMKSVVTTGNGGYEKLVYKDVAIPAIMDYEVLIKVLAAGINNTEINTRLGWYSSSVTESTNNTSNGGVTIQSENGGWNKQIPFPFIQGTDSCGKVISTVTTVDNSLLGKRVLIRPCIRDFGFSSLSNICMGSDFDGAFAQYVKVRASEVFPVVCDWTDAELGMIPCAYGTSENMLHKADLKKEAQKEFLQKNT